MVRKLTPEEVKPALVKLWAKVQPEIHYADPLDPNYMGDQWAKLGASRCPAYGLFDDNEEPVGMFLGIIFPDMHAPGLMHGMEYFWAVQKAHRRSAIRLLKAFEVDCKAAGCQSVSVGAMVAHEPESRRALYAHLGYAPHSEMFLKKLA